MEILFATVGITAIIWISIGIMVHAAWVLKIFRSESTLITSQQLMTKKHRSLTFPIPESLSSKNLLVFGYWGDRDYNDQVEVLSPAAKSPVIFRYANLALVVCTSTFVLIIFGRALFSSLKLI